MAPFRLCPAVQEEDDGVEGASGAVRAEKLSSAVEQTKRSIEEMVGAEAMGKLYELLKQRSDSDGGSGASDNSIADLSRVVFKIIPYDKAEVLSLVYKLLYLEGQLVEPANKE
jgi:NIMA (never in mitosis gene a)-related kinase